MKKSEIFKYAQLAILDTPNLLGTTKLEILRELMDKEDVALYVEKTEAEKKAAEV